MGMFMFVNTSKIFANSGFDAYIDMFVLLTLNNYQVKIFTRMLTM